MTVTIFDYEEPYDTHHRYNVSFFNTDIRTTVTDQPSIVTSWIDDIERIHNRHLHRLIVGLDLEWRPNFDRNQNNRVATVQLCVGRQCLIFQILNAPYIPRSLEDFLGNSDYTFVGLGIDKDVEKLWDHYGVRVAKFVDLRPQAARVYGMEELRNAGLKDLTRLVLGKEIEKPMNVTLSRWDNQRLTPPQVMYACVDAYVSFQMGKALRALNIGMDCGLISLREDREEGFWYKNW